MPCEDEDTQGDSVRQERQRLESCSCEPRNIKDREPPPEARHRQGEMLPRASGGAGPHQALDFRLGASTTVRAYTSVLRPPGLRHFVLAARNRYRRLDTSQRLLVASSGGHEGS